MKKEINKKYFDIFKNFCYNYYIINNKEILRFLDYINKIFYKKENISNGNEGKHKEDF